MTTKTKTREMAVRCSFENEAGRCNWIGSAPTVRELGGLYTAHWPETHKRKNSVAVRDEVRAVYNDPEAPTADQLVDAIERSGLAINTISIPVRTARVFTPEELAERIATEGEVLTYFSLGLVRPNPYQADNLARLKRGIEALMASIGLVGQEQPAIGRLAGAGWLELAAGHRRHKALTMLPDDNPFKQRGLWVAIREMTDEEMLVAVIEENRHREDLQPHELALQVEHIIEQARTRGSSIGTTELADMMGVRKPTISNGRRTLRATPKDVLELIVDGVMSWSAMRPLLPMTIEDKGGHQHPDEVRMIVAKAMPWMLEATHTGPAVKTKDVKEALSLRLAGRWRTDGNYAPGKHGLQNTAADLLKWRPLDSKAQEIWHAYSTSRKQFVDRKAYQELAPGQVHDFTEKEIDLGLWACNEKVWNRLSAKAEAGRKAKGDSGTSHRSSGTRSNSSGKRHVDLMAEVTEMLRSAKATKLRGFQKPKDMQITPTELMAAAAEPLIDMSKLASFYTLEMDDRERDILINNPLFDRSRLQVWRNPKDGGIVVLEEIHHGLGRLSRFDFKRLGLAFGVKGRAESWMSSQEIKSNFRPRLLITNWEEFLKAVKTERDRVRKAGHEAKKAEIKLLLKVGRTLATGGLGTRKRKQFLAAVLIERGSILTKPDRNQGEPDAHMATGWFGEKFGVELVSRRAEINRDAIAVALETLDEDALDQLMFDYLVRAIEDPRDGEYFEGRAEYFAGYLFPAETSGD